ncbi:electron transport complex subunit RsxE [Candidatus Pantoea carbekii]|uniref:Electron transport complex RsxE subunit n=1 Tax=Candidatus Pantoea carbekii TaxID=1235990 RepID=U3U9P1_9GAMM|nr:electron transport complex subunit RsxE [Candidatus Pantoea carbekii]AKC32082.1 electron transport protein RnfE [Candidatus Pantoea carbekii]BAO00608.1 electron transport complex RsxE subunit [Candidatus Pantoea carbekii]
MSRTENLFLDSFWKNNFMLVQILVLCPILALISSAASAFGVGLVTTFVLTLTNLVIATCHRYIPFEIRIPIYIMIISCIVSCVQMFINAYAYNLYQLLEIFSPLIITNCTIIVGRTEIVASKYGILLFVLDGFAIGISATCFMFILGAIRELIGNGTIFNEADKLLGSWAKIFRIEIVHFKSPMLLALLPPGGFIGLGVLLTLKYFINYKINLKIKQES